MPHPDAELGYRAADWLIRVSTPTWLERVGWRNPEARALRDLDPLVDEAAIDRAGPPLRAALDLVQVDVTTRQRGAARDEARRLVLDEVADEAIAGSGWPIAWAAVGRTVGFRSEIALDDAGTVVRNPEWRDPLRTARYTARNAAYLVIWDVVWAVPRADGRAVARATLAPTVQPLQSFAAACFSRTSST